MREKGQNGFMMALFTIFIILSLIIPDSSLSGSLPDTGLTECYDNLEDIPCPQPGEPFYGQDAQYNCNPQSYTKLDANGNDLPNDAPWPWTMVRDNVTGLIWENKTDDGGIHDNNRYNWYDAQDVFIAALNNDNFGGFSDWRLPAVKELMSIVTRDGYSPSLNTFYFSHTDSSYYWSSTAYAFNIIAPDGVWLVNFDDGSTGGDTKSDTIGHYVRAVRGGQSTNKFIDNRDGTVSDTDTGLMWQKDTAPGDYSWREALTYCENLTLAGYSDWRLPDINELQSIVNYDRYDPSIDTTHFPNTASNWVEYWSSTTIADDPNYAWVVFFFDGSLELYCCNKSDFVNHYVRAVRGGQCGPSDTTTTTTATITDSTTTTVSPVTSSIAPGSTTTTTAYIHCPAETIYGEHSEQTELLRYFRDNVLNQNPEGQELTRLYYQWSPIIVKAMEEDEGFKGEVKKMIDGILEFIRGAVE